MIIKYFILSVFILLISFLCNYYMPNNILFFPAPDKYNAIKTDTIYDVDGMPIFSNIHIDSINNGVTAHYLSKRKDTINSNLVRGVQYMGGYEQLSSYCDSLYYNQKNYSYEELNATAYYVILFNRELQIKEIRIIRRLLYDNEKYNYDDLIKKILLLTEGKWIKGEYDKEYDWYFYFGRFHLK